MGLDERIKYAAMKAKHKKKLEPWHKKWWGVIVIIGASLLGIFLAASLIYVISEANRINQGSSARYIAEQQEKYLEAINRRSANTYGPTDAPVTIIEFSDFACPFCRDSYAGLKALRLKYPDSVRIIYRDYPLHDTSIFLALAARCAGEQGRFWQMHDIFFEHQERLQVSVEDLELVMPEIAGELQLNALQFQACIDSQRHFSQIEQDYNDGTFLQVEGTPTWFINNYRFTGHIPADKLEELVTGMLVTSNLKQ